VDPTVKEWLVNLQVEPWMKQPEYSPDRGGAIEIKGGESVEVPK
jgi:hypothetical protein